MLLKTLRYIPLEDVKVTKHDNSLTLSAIATKEGVWKGVYRSASIVEANTRWLLGKPITIHHPAGRASSSEAVGQIVGAEYIPDIAASRVSCELWPSKIAPELMERIEKAARGEEIVDVSTGFIVIEEKQEGVWEGQEYHAVETSLDYDHLAIVNEGACSAVDGCGLGYHSKDLETIEPSMEALGNALGWSCAMVHNKGDLTEEIKTHLDKMVDSLKGHEDMNQFIESLSPCKKEIMLHSSLRVAKLYKDEQKGEKNMTSKDGKVKEGQESTPEVPVISKIEDLQVIISGTKDLKPEEAATKAIGALTSIADMWTAKQGPFVVPAVETPKFPVASVGEEGLTFTEGTLEESKAAFEGFHSKTKELEGTMKTQAEQIASLSTEIATMKGHQKAELMKKIKGHSGLTDEELKVYDGMDNDKLQSVADHFAKLKGHSKKEEDTTPLTPPAGMGGHGKRTKEELMKMNDEMDQKLGFKPKGGK